MSSTDCVVDRTLSHDEMPDLLIAPDRLRVQTRIGAGASGEVFLCTLEPEAQMVAVKQV